MIHHDYLVNPKNCDTLKTSCLTVSDLVSSRYAEWLAMQDSNYMYFAKGSTSTQLYETYNIFLCHLPGISETYELVTSYFKSKNSDYKKYAISGWVNVHNNGGYLDWHIHGSDINVHDDRWHGYVCVNAEPSNTYYKTENNEIKTINNKNGYITLSAAGMQHRTSAWENDKEPRITIAFDCILREQIDYNLITKWIPIT